MEELRLPQLFKQDLHPRFEQESNAEAHGKSFSSDGARSVSGKRGWSFIGIEENLSENLSDAFLGCIDAGLRRSGSLESVWF